MVVVVEGWEVLYEITINLLCLGGSFLNGLGDRMILAIHDLQVAT